MWGSVVRVHPDQPFFTININVMNTDFLQYSKCKERNETLLWYASDSESLFDKHQQNTSTKLQLKKLNWNKNSITYKFNNYGFRSDSFSKSPGVIFLGCSLAFGVGLPYKKTWPYLISKKLNLSCWNLSQPAGSLDTCYRLAKYWVPVLKPEYIFILKPSVYRREYYSDIEERFINIGSWQYKHYPNLVDFINEESSIINHDKNIDAIKFISSTHNIPLIIQETTGDEVPSGPDPLEKYKLARDLMHPGIEFHASLINDTLNLM